MLGSHLQASRDLNYPSVGMPHIVPVGSRVSISETAPSSEAESITSGEDGFAERQYMAGMSP